MPKVLHTADWHLGKHLKRFDLIEPQREALERLLAVIDDERPDLVALAGDVFDVGERPTLAALRTWDWVAEEIVRRRPGGLPLVVIPGNHDHPERLAVNARLSRDAGLHLRHELDRAHDPLRLAGLEVFALPFHKPARVRALAAREARAGDDAGEASAADAAGAIGDFDYHAAMEWMVRRALGGSAGDRPRLLLAHAFVEGAGEEGAGEDPVMVGGAGAVAAHAFDGFDYVALGHLHGPRALPGRPWVRYAGSLYPCSFDESGERTVAIVEWPEGAPAGTAPQVRTRPLTVRRRVRAVRDLTFDEVIRRGEAARAAGDAAADDYLLASVTDRTPIAHAQARLTEVHPHGVFEQRRLDVVLDDGPELPDVDEASVEEVFLAFFRHVLGDDERPTDAEAEILRAALADLHAPDADGAAAADPATSGGGGAA